MDLFFYFFRAYPLRTIIVFIGITIASLITAVTLLALPALLFTLLGRSSAKTQFINDFLSQAGMPPSTENLIIFLIICIILQSAFLACSNIYAGFTKAKVAKDLRVKLITLMSQTEWGFFTKQSSGNFTASLLNEIDITGDGYETMVVILSNIVQMLAYLSVAFFISWQIAVIAIITSIILAVLFRRLISISRKLGDEDTILVRKITAQLTDSYRSIKPLKAMAREKHSHAILNSYTKQLKSVNKKDTVASQTLEMFQEIILMSTVILTIYFSFKQLNIPIEFSIVLVILYLRSMKLFGKSQKQFRTYVGNISGYHMVMQYMNAAIENREQRNGTIRHKFHGNIEFKNVYFTHGQKQILNNASTTFHHKKLNTVIGRSGAGKTTIADLICGLYYPSSGEIVIDGIPLSEIDISNWRKQIGYVTQENNLLNTSVKENITLGDPKFSNEDIHSALIKSHSDSFINQLPYGIETNVGENGAHLSGGQRQRVLIARALVHSPKLLILDEATSALDSETELLLSEIFKELSKEMTIISISHRPALVEISDHIIRLDKGKLSPLQVNV
jgi:ATP-binding cassette subfamily C protein